jgi:hypothetical protein
LVRTICRNRVWIDWRWLIRIIFFDHTCKPALGAWEDEEAAIIQGEEVVDSALRLSAGVRNAELKSACLGIDKVALAAWDECGLLKDG